LFSCPYCSQNSYKATGLPFSNWKSVRKHVSTCKLNSNSYIICENEGPINWEVINTFSSLQELKEKYPKLAFHDHFWLEQRKKNKTTIRLKEFSTQDIIQSIQQFYLENNRIPQSRDFKHNSKYPNSTTVEKRFGSWNTAIEAAGYTPNDNYGYGINTLGKDKILYRSQVEAYFADNFLYNKFEYEYEKPYGNGWFYDFYIKELDLYIEITAGLNQNRIQEKIEFNKDKNFILLHYEEIYKKDFKLQNMVIPLVS
jgi:hypothetical protein